MRYIEGPHEISKSHDKDGGGVPLGITSLSATQKKTGIPMRSTTSGSSREQSDDDDEAEGETATTENMDPADAKRVRRYFQSVLPHYGVLLLVISKCGVDLHW